MRRRGIGRSLFRADLSGRAATARKDVAAALVVACACLVIPAVAGAAFPGTDPAESPRANAPNDPDFDRCEADNEGGPECQSYFEEEFRAFGFSPDSTQPVPLAPSTALYADCNPLTPAGDGQLDELGEDANEAAEGSPLERCNQIAGVRVDSAWKYFTPDSPGDLPGREDVSVAILDTGARWQNLELKNKIALNRDELPIPLSDRATPLEGGGGCALAAAYDADGDGAFNVRDYRCDSLVSLNGGDEESDSVLDPSDLIAAFSDDTDDDANGYADDIAGWDFFDDDNDPFDASSCCSANGHGTGRAIEAAGETNNNRDGVGMCPDCQIMPLRVWDTFVVPIDYFALGVLYATENGASVVEGAVGGLGNTRFARDVFRYADLQKVALTMVSSDINSANHNYPTNYNEAIYVAGAYPDTAPNNTCTGPGSLPGVDVLPIPSPPTDFTEGCNQLNFLLNDLLGVQIVAQPPTLSFFRNSNLTQYGGKADIVMMGATGSEDTGQASGAAALLASFGRDEFPGNPLTGNEIRQLLTMTAEDVRAVNTNPITFPDKAETGWDPHFGYGRVNLAAAMKRIADDDVPPEAQIDAPAWFAPINVDRVDAGGLDITGRVESPHGDVGDWRIEYACGQDAPDSAFLPIPGATGSGDASGVLGTIPLAILQDLADKSDGDCNGEVATDAGRPAGGAGSGWPADPYPDPDPERHAFQIRLTAEEDGNADNFGRYRKTLFAYENDGNLDGWPRPIGSGSDADAHVTGSGGEVSPRLYDVDGDNELDVIETSTSGELKVLDSDGTPIPSFNGGTPVSTGLYALGEAHADGVPLAVGQPRESPRVPAIGDIDGDLEPEIVLNAGEHIYAWDMEGNPVEGFEAETNDAGLDRTLSEPCLGGVTAKPCFNTADRRITSSNHIKRGFLGSVALADLDCDQDLEVIAGAMDQHLYAWRGNGSLVPGFPRKLQSAGADGAEIVTTPAVAELDGRGCDATGAGPKGPEIVISTNEVIGGDPPEEFPPLFELFNTLLQSATGSNPVYAVHSNGTSVPGWPVKVGVAAGDLLPMVLPGHDSAILDQDANPADDEVSVAAATSIVPGGPRLVDGNGAGIREYLASAGNLTDPGPVLSLADYSSVGDVIGAGQPAVLKGGLTLNGAANLLAVNQNLPFNHTQMAWDPSSGAALPGYPIATDDFQLLGQASVARVGGSGPERHMLVGTGLYNLHAYGPMGTEAPGWPKFTGGWQQATPAVGDADGDGDLDVTTVTREGWSFLWDTASDPGDDDGVDACGSATDPTNDEWWTFHHDERSTNNYRGDGRPPRTPEDLVLVRGPGDRVDLSVTAPGDDWACGQADVFRVIVSPNPITKPTDGTVAAQLGADASSRARPRARS